MPSWVLLAFYAGWLVLGGGGFVALRDGWLCSAMEASLVLPLAVRAWGGAEDRLAWALLAGGVAMWVTGDILFSFSIGDLKVIPEVTLADPFFLAFYPFAFAWLFLIARRQPSRFRNGFWMDGVVSGLGASAYGALVVHRVASTTHSSLGGAVTDLAYPIGDVWLLVMVIAGLSLLGWRANRLWWLAMAGCAVFALADINFLIETTTNSYQQGGVLDAGWPLGLALLGASATVRGRSPAQETEGRGLIVVPVIMTASCLALLVYASRHTVEWDALALAAASLVAVLVRTVVSFLEVVSLGEAKRRSAIIESSGDAMVAEDHDGSVVSWNPAAEVLFGHAARDALGQPRASMLLPEHSSTIDALRDRVLEGVLVEPVELGGRRPDGSLLWVSMAVSPLYDRGLLIGVSTVSRDVTDRKVAELAASEAQGKLAEAQRIAQLGSFHYDPVTGSISGSDEFHRILGLAPTGSTPLGAVLGVLHPDDRDSVLGALARRPADADRLDLVHRIVRPDGSIRWVQVHGRWQVGASGEGGLVGNVLDVTNREEAERSRRSAEQRFRVGFERSPIGMAMTGLDGRLLAANPALCAIIGRPADEIVGRYVDEYTHPEDIALTAAAIEAGGQSARSEDGRIEKRYVRPDGTVVPVQLDFILVEPEGGDAPYLLAQVQDITERKKAAEALLQQSFYDPLTGLANRSLVMDRLQVALSRSVRAKVPLAVMLLDVNDLKSVNDSYGRPSGDAVLVEVSHRLTSVLGPGGTVGRLDGDEFVVIAENVGSEVEAQQIGERLAGTFSIPFAVQAGPLALTASIGISLASAADSEEDVLRDASSALYRARQSGRGRMQIFNPAHRHGQSDVLRLRAAIKQACDRRDFRVAYQPVVDTGTGHIVSLEALLRWTHPEMGIMSPAEFIPIAEEMGILEEISGIVLDQVCRDTVPIAAAAGAPIPISVNLSASQLSDPGCAERIITTLSEHSVDPHLMMFEVTETAVMSDLGAAGAILAALRRHGARIAVDDFGTGYSSLSLLRQLPVDVVKIDRSFIVGLGSTPGDTVIVDAVISLAHALGLTVIAEGVEKPLHMEELQRLGCRYAQGYLWSEPIDVAGLRQILAQPPWRRSAKSKADVTAGVFEPVAVPRSILDSLPCSTALIDHTGTIVATNLVWKQFAAGAGADPVGSGIGANYLAVCDAAGEDQFATEAAAGIRSILSGELESFLGEYPCETPQGCRWFQMTVARAAASGAGAVVMHFDTTSSHLAQQAMRESEIRARATFDRAPIGIVRLDIDGRVIAANGAFAGIVGRSSEELLGAPASLVWDQSSWADAEAQLGRLVRGEVGSYNTERRFRHVDGTIRHANVSASLVRSAEGDPAFVIVTVEDITDRRELAERLRRSEELDAIGRLAGGIAHEINTPTQFIASNLSYLGVAFEELTGIVQEMLKRQGAETANAISDDPTGTNHTGVAGFDDLINEIPDAIADATEGIERVSSIVKALKAFGHPDQGEARPADINEALRQTLIVARNEYKYVADVDTDFGDLPLVTCFVGELKQAFLNLIVNAADAIRDVVGERGDRGRIRVTTRCADDETIVTISDTGNGIPPEISDRVFEPFFTTKEVGKGTGQGLALARSTVVDHHGGELSFRSAPARGTEFTIRLPAPSQVTRQEVLR